MECIRRGTSMHSIWWALVPFQGILSTILAAEPRADYGEPQANLGAPAGLKSSSMREKNWHHKDSACRMSGR